MYFLLNKVKSNQWQKNSASERSRNIRQLKKDNLETLDKNRMSNLIQGKIPRFRIVNLEINGTTTTKTKEMSKNITTDGFNITTIAIF